MLRRHAIVLVCLMALSAGSMAAESRVRLGWESAGRRVFPDSEVQGVDLKDVGTLSAAGHEYEAVQLVVIARQPLQNVHLALAPLTCAKTGNVISADNVTLGLVNTVKIKGKAWPDPIFPYRPFDVKAGERQSVWMTVYVPANTPAGTYVSVVTLRADGALSLSTRLSVKVWGFDLPVIGSLKTITCWEFDPSYRDVMLAHRFNPGGQGVGDVARPGVILKKDGTLGFDWEHYDRTMQDCFAKGMSCFGLPWWAGDGTGDQFYRMIYDIYDEATEQTVRVELNPLKEERERELTRQWFAGFSEHLKEKGWFDRAVVYLWDEPGYKPIPTILKLSAFIKSVDPDYKILLTEWPLDVLYPAVDIFCTHVVNLRDPHLPVMRKAQKAGKELWWYSCDDPYPSPTYTIPHDALILRVMGWSNWKYDLPGRVYFTFTWDREKDPFTTPGLGGEGNGLLVYPMQDGKPVISIRLEMHRDGIEDYEYLAILKRQIAAAADRGVDAPLIADATDLLTIPADLVSRADAYTADPQVIEAHRAIIARMIETLKARR